MTGRAELFLVVVSQARRLEVMMSGMRRGGAGFVVIVAALGALATTTQAAGTPACRTHDLRITELNSQGAAGTRIVAMAYRNATTTTCHTQGFPGVTLLGTHGRRLAVAKRSALHHPARLVLRPGKRVVGVLTYSETPVPENERCARVTAVRIYAPNSRQSSRVALRDTGQYCARAEVKPLARSAVKSLQG
jgi:D-serine deaminase-like pyridoxal phosphate-dependent protein